MAIRIRAITTQRLDIAMKKPIRMSFGEISRQHVMLVRISDHDGNTGVGEACVMGGPYWNADTIEAVEAIILTYAAPYLIGQVFKDLKAFSARLTMLFRGNGSARCALEMACLDLLGKASCQSAAQLLGGAVREHIPVAWTLSSESAAIAIDQGEQAISERGHRMFKLKVGIQPAPAEVQLVEAVVRNFSGRATLLVDANQAWTEAEARHIFPLLRDAGVNAVEQPVSGYAPLLMASLLQDYALPIIADEPLVNPGVAAMFCKLGSASGFALKPQRDGGLFNTLQTASMAANAGLACYGGTMLETSLGTSAWSSLYACVADLRWGCELFGPLRLEDDIAINRFVIKDGMLKVSDTPGLGIQLDEERVTFLASKAV